MPAFSFTATIDSYMQGVPEDGKGVNYGSSGPLMVGVMYSSGTKAALFNAIGNFDVSSLTGATINAAKLVHNIVDRAGSNSAKVKRCTRPSTWTEAGVTWNTYDGTNNWTTSGGDVDDTTPTPVAFNIPANAGSFEITGMKDFVTDALNNRSGIVSVIYLLDNQDPGTDQTMRWKARNETPEPWKLIVDHGPFVKNIHVPINQAVNRANTY